MQETWVGSLGQEDLLEEETETHSSILAWKIPWTEEPCELQSEGSQRVGRDWVTEHTYQKQEYECFFYDVQIASILHIISNWDKTVLVPYYILLNFCKLFFNMPPYSSKYLSI